MNQIGTILIYLALCMTLFGLVRFWHRPSRTYWFTLTWVAVVVVLVVQLGSLPIQWDGFARWVD